MLALACGFALQKVVKILITRQNWPPETGPRHEGLLSKKLLKSR